MKILIAEDEKDLRRILTTHFSQRGFDISTASDGAAALALFRADTPDLMLLDIRMPELNGWQVLEKVREESSVPIILITALDDAKDAIRGLEMGANDYVRKPFDFGELEARIDAVMRVPSPTQHTLETGPLRIDRRAKSVLCDGETVHLTPKSYALLLLLASDPGKVFSHEEIIHQVWPENHKADGLDIKQCIHTLRQRLQQASCKGDLVQNVAGFGYRLFASENNGQAT